MKKVVYFCILMSALLFFACGKASVEDVARDYVKKQCAFDNDVRIDTSKLKYTVTKKEGNNATVSVSGTINLDGQLFLVKQGKNWKISKKEDLYAVSKTVVPPAGQEKTVSHTEQTISPNPASHE